MSYLPTLAMLVRALAHSISLHLLLFAGALILLVAFVASLLLLQESLPSLVQAQRGGPASSDHPVHETQRLTAPVQHDSDNSHPQQHQQQLQQQQQQEQGGVSQSGSPSGGETYQTDPNHQMATMLPIRDDANALPTAQQQQLQHGVELELVCSLSSVRLFSYPAYLLANAMDTLVAISLGRSSSVLLY